jgi:hypothetical protein
MEDIIRIRDEFDDIKMRYFDEVVGRISHLMVMSNIVFINKKSMEYMGDPPACICCNNEMEECSYHKYKEIDVCLDCHIHLDCVKKTLKKDIVSRRLLIANLPLLDDINGLINDIYLDVLRV